MDNKKSFVLTGASNVMTFFVFVFVFVFFVFSLVRLQGDLQSGPGQLKSIPVNIFSNVRNTDLLYSGFNFVN